MSRNGNDTDHPGSPQLVIAGWGQPLLGDDAAGWRVAESIATRWPAEDGRLIVLQAQQPLPEWALALSNAQFACFVDAVASPGENRLRLLELQPKRMPQSLDGHRLDAQGLIDLTAELFGRAPRTRLLLLPARQFQVGAGLSARTANAVARAVRLLESLIASQITEWPVAANDSSCRELLLEAVV